MGEQDDPSKVAGEIDDDIDEESRFRRFTRRLLDRRELAEDTKELLATLVTTSDKAKSEMVRMAGREVRNYLEGLQLKEDLLDIATNYRLEVRASFHLEPIADALADDEEPAVKGKAARGRAEPAPDPEDDEG